MLLKNIMYWKSLYLNQCNSYPSTSQHCSMIHHKCTELVQTASRVRVWRGVTKVNTNYFMRPWAAGQWEWIIVKDISPICVVIVPTAFHLKHMYPCLLTASIPSKPTCIKDQYLGTFTWLQKEPISFLISIHLSVHTLSVLIPLNQSVKFDIGDLYANLLRKPKFG